MIRKTLSIVAGYAIFVAASLAFFKISGQKPHSDPTTDFALTAAICGAVYSLVAGLVTQFISGSKTLKINYVLALIIAGFATFSFFKSEGNHWTQLLAIFVFAPASILGGLIFVKIKSR